MSRYTIGEQIGRGGRVVNAPWRWIKRQTARKRRRLAKLLGDDAPAKDRFRGYVA